MSDIPSLKLDETDRKILLELETNARQSSAKIAKKVRLSEDAINYRIKKYLRNGLISKFFVIPLFDKLGFTTYRIYFQFKATSAKKEEEIISYIRDRLPCQWIGICDGQWDVVARISAKDIFQFNTLMDTFFEEYSQYILRKEFTVQLRHTWWPSTYGLADSSKKRELRHEIPKKVNPVKYDNIDLKLLSILIDEARLPTVEIAKRVGVSADSIHYRMKKLVKLGVITQIKSYFNRQKLGYQHNQVFLKLNQNPKRIDAIISFLNNFEQCFFISSMVGAWDMQIGIDAKDSLEFHALLSKIKEEYSDVIAGYETLIVYREYAPNPFNYFLANPNNAPRKEKSTKQAAA